jgi:hypothetical protein
MIPLSPTHSLVTLLSHVPNLYIELTLCTTAISVQGLSKRYPTFGGEKYISYVTGLGP